MTRRLAVCLVTVVTGLLLNMTVFAQGAYPVKSPTLVVPFATGGTTDLITRLLARELTNQMGRPVIVDNRAGGGGVIGWSSVARAPADGYTLQATDMSYSIASGLLTTLPFDARKAFHHVSTAMTVPHAMVITPSLPVKNVKEFIALAKARPNELNYGVRR